MFSIRPRKPQKRTESTKELTQNEEIHYYSPGGVTIASSVAGVGDTDMCDVMRDDVEEHVSGENDEGDVSRLTNDRQSPRYDSTDVNDVFAPAHGDTCRITPTLTTRENTSFIFK